MRIKATVWTKRNLGSKLRVVIILAITITMSLLTRPYALGQSTSASMANGFPENGVFEGSAFDSVQINNGNLHLEIPFISIEGRIHHVYHYAYRYDNRGWGYKTTTGPNGQTLQQVVPEVFNGMRFRLPDPSEGFDVSFTTSEQNVPCFFDQGLQQEFYGYIVSGHVVVEKNGTKHGFIPDQVGPIGENCPVTGPFRAYATDGSGWVADIGADGKFVRVLNKAGDQTQIDTNGNTPTAEIPSEPQYWIANSTTGNNEFRYYDSNGSQQAVAVSYTSVSVQTQLCQFAEHCGSADEYTATWSQPEIIKLPNGLTYQFAYEQNEYGEPNSVILPTGAQIQWTWGNLDQGGRKVTSRKITVNGQSFLWQYFWGNAVAGGSWQNSMVDPLGNKTVYTCRDLHGVFDQDPFPACAITQTQYYQIQANGSLHLVKTVNTDYCPGAQNCTVTGVLVPIRETTTWNDTNQVTKVETDWDSIAVAGATTTWKNVLERREFDYGSGQPGPLLRRTDYDYAHLHSDPIYQPYRDANLADLVLSEMVYDGGDHLVSKTVNTYDDTPLDSTAASPATGHDYTKFGTANTIRGNLTSTSRWRNTDGVMLKTINTYDDLGNLRSTKDPNGNITSFIYSDSWATSSCLATGFSSQSFVTQVTNALNQNTQTAYYPCTGLKQAIQNQNDINAGRPGTTYTYDLMNRPLTIVYSDDGRATFDYHGDALPLTTTKTVLATPSPDIVTSAAYDGLGRVSQSSIDSAPGLRILVDITYDALGRKSAESNPHTSAVNVTDGITSFEYDALNRMTSLTKQDGGAVTTDYSQFPTVTITDEAGKQRRSRTDALGRLVEVDEPPAGGVPVQNDYATLQTDGNFVLYTPSNAALWSTGTAGTGGGPLEVLDDGNLVLYQFKWQVGTYRAWDGSRYADDSCKIGDSLLAGQILSENQCLENTTNTTFALMSNGDLEIYDRQLGQITWKSNTWGNTGAYLVMQSDGNLVIYSTDGLALWASGTYGSGANVATLENDGRLIIYSTIWNSGTSQGQVAGSMAHPSCDLGWALGITGVMGTGQCFVSHNGRFELLLQTDGNLVLYDRSTAPVSALWSTGTAVTAFSPGVVLQTLYTYDTLGNLLCVEQHGNVTGTGCSAPPSSDATSPWRVRRFTYDSLSRLLSASNPESNSGIDSQTGNPVRVPTTYSYDPDGNLVQKTSPAPNQTGTATQTISYCYDELHRLTDKSYTAQPPVIGQPCTLTGVVEHQAYDAGTNGIGHLTSVTDQAGSASYSYDVLGRLSSETRVINGISKKVSYEYNLDGSLKTLHYPSGAAVDYTPDSAGRMISAIDNGNSINYVTGATYQADGQTTGFVSGNGAAFAGITSSFAYNKRLQPVTMAASSPSQTVFSVGYDFHAGDGTAGSGSDNGNVWNLYNYRDRTRDQSFTYDLLNRLTSAQNAGTDCTATTANGKTEYWGNTYGYDAWGNLISKSVTKCSAENLTLTALANNQLSGYGYDAAGNMTWDPTDGVSATYDQENRIASAVTAQGTFTYTYDADGNRVEKSGGGSGTLYWYMTPGIVAESDLAGNLKSEFVFFNGERVARRDFDASTGAATGVFYYFSDHVKTASVITDAAGNITAESDYYPWGGELQFVNNDSNHYKFTGKERDSESGLDYFGARYYSSGLGRFITPDWAAKAVDVPYAEFSDPQSLNLYSYVRNIPTVKVDADGHDGCCTTLPDPTSADWDLIDAAGAGGGISFSAILTGAGMVFGGAMLFPQALPGGTVGQSNADEHAAMQQAQHEREQQNGGADPQVSTSGAGARKGGGKAYDDTPENLARMAQGKPPIGKDGKPVELHSPDQTHKDKSRELTRTDHRGKGNFTKNHQNTGQQRSEVNRNQAAKDRRAHWKKVHKNKTTQE